MGIAECIFGDVQEELLIKIPPVQSYMSKRKLTIVVDINDDAVNRIVDLEREILSQNICSQACRRKGLTMCWLHQIYGGKENEENRILQS
ncbi:MAG: hypothetical protein GIS02_01050 [Methanosarcinales archaeon]|uniref:Uncharacterized protein n=1 Tax=Candidatus Ethanoperedens thermophilum TaxID=2766897 RepID=A0A848D913_9EURY|nr:hypothetical protein [Candidatus Ethanoperedens thermophilum]